MAPPGNRRPGYSRRAQYSTFFGYIAGVVGALVGAVLLVVSLIDPGAMGWLRGLATDASEPPAKAVAGSRDYGRGFLAVAAGYARAGSENARLRRELGEARTRLAEAEAVRSENRRLKLLLGLRDEDSATVAVTRITSSTAASTRRLATIGAGASDGVAVGMPVRSVTGLVGRVIETGRSTARVMLITDTDSVVPVRRASDGVPAFVQGRGDGMLKVRLINLGINPLKKGDVFVTSGSGGLYRPGIALATVTGVTADGAVARVLSDPAATEYVSIEQSWAPPAEQPSTARAPNPSPSQAATPKAAQ